MTIAQVILNNNWKATSVNKSTAVNAVLESGIIATGSQDAQDMLNAINEQNVNSTITTSLIGYAWAEGNIGNSTSTVPASLAEAFTEAKVKVNYINQWWGVPTIQKDLLASTTPNLVVNEFIGRFWAETYNKMMTSTITGLATITALVNDILTGTFTANAVLDTMLIKGDMGMKGLNTMQCNSATFISMKKKEPAMFTQTFGDPILKVVGGTETYVRGKPTGWLYDGYVRVIIDDTMVNGLLALVDENAFVLVEKTNIEKPLMYKDDPKGGNGAGLEDFGTKKLFVVHPLGFNFVGVQGTTYADKGGLTMAELASGSQYALAVDKKLSPITFLKFTL